MADTTIGQKSGAVVSNFLRTRVTGRALVERSLQWLCMACALLCVVTTFSIIYFLVTENIPFFKQVNPWEFLTGTTWSPLVKPNSYGVLPLINGTMLIAIGAGLFALPLGLLSAIYLSEFASTKTRSFLKPVLEVLAGIPTVVYGFFGLTVVTPFLKTIFPSTSVFNAASGAIVVGIMILPLVSSLCEDALSAVPKALREGAYGLGSTKYEVTMKVVVPGALSGIMSAFILAISRAIGETMAVTLAAGMTPKISANFLDSVQTMTAYIVQVSKGDTPHGSIGYMTIFAVGFALFIITYGLNLLARQLVRKYRRAYE